MDNKLSELSKPVMYVVRTLDGSVASVKNYKYTAPKGFTSNPLYSQEYVSALQHESAVNWEAATSLVAENEELKRALEAKDKRMAELENDEVRQRLANAEHQLHMAELRAHNARAGRIAQFRKRKAAEKRLATPVRLPEPCVYEVNGTRFYDRLSESEVIATLREQGFTVEGDE